MGSNKRFYKKYNNSICFKDEKKENREHEIKLIEDINNLQRDIPTSNTMEDDFKKLQDKKSE